MGRPRAGPRLPLPEPLAALLSKYDSVEKVTCVDHLGILLPASPGLPQAWCFFAKHRLPCTLSAICAAAQVDPADLLRMQRGGAP
jgi:hypothetical protein